MRVLLGAVVAPALLLLVLAIFRRRVEPVRLRQGSSGTTGRLKLSARLVRSAEIELVLRDTYTPCAASDGHRRRGSPGDCQPFNPRIRTRVVGPTELLLVETEAGRDVRELRGDFRPSSWDRIREYTVEAAVFTYDFLRDVRENVLLVNETYYYRIEADDATIDAMIEADAMI